MGKNWRKPFGMPKRWVYEFKRLKFYGFINVEDLRTATPTSKIRLVHIGEIRVRSKVSKYKIGNTKLETSKQFMSL